MTSNATSNKRSRRRLLIFTTTRLADMLEKGNLQYVRFYEVYFNDVFLVYLFGHKPRVKKMGRTRLISIGGSRQSYIFDIIFAPFRLLFLARRIRCASFLTADMLFSWWTTLLLKIVCRSRIVVMPVCTPEEIYKNTGSAFSGFPIWMERFLRFLSFKAADSILVAKNSGATRSWLDSAAYTRSKVCVADATPEEMPPPVLFNRARHIQAPKKDAPEIPSLLYVGRLEQEKHAPDLIEMMGVLHGRGIKARLMIAGDGALRESMEKRAQDLKVAERIEFLGFVNAADLAKYYEAADIFVSTLTGTALKEAAFFSLPIVAYNIDYIPYLLKHEDTALLADSVDPVKLAHEVERFIVDPSLRINISRRLLEFARNSWSEEAVGRGLGQAFGCDADAA